MFKQIKNFRVSLTGLLLAVTWAGLIGLIGGWFFHANVAAINPTVTISQSKAK